VLGLAYQVNANVSQYDMRHETNRVLSGSHIPLLPASWFLALDARSIGTSNTMLAGNHNAKNMGTKR